VKQPPGHAIVVVENWQRVPSQYPGRYRSIVRVPEHVLGGGESQGLSPGPPEEDDELDDDELDASASLPASPASCLPESTGSVSSKEHATNGIVMSAGGSVEAGGGGGLPGNATPPPVETPFGSTTSLDAKMLEPPVHAVTSPKAAMPPKSRRARRDEPQGPPRVRRVCVCAVFARAPVRAMRERLHRERDRGNAGALWHRDHGQVTDTARRR